MLSDLIFPLSQQSTYTDHDRKAIYRYEKLRGYYSRVVDIMDVFTIRALWYIELYVYFEVYIYFTLCNPQQLQLLLDFSGRIRYNSTIIILRSIIRIDPMYPTGGHFCIFVTL